MDYTPKQGELFPEVNVPDGTMLVNARCLVRTQNRHRVVIVSGIAIAQYTLGDRT